MKQRAGGHSANLPAIDLYKTVDLATWTATGFLAGA
jgi:hypothetical protein